MKRTRVIIADDHKLVRVGIRTALEPFVNVRVVAEARDGKEVYGMAARYQPDVIFMDICIPRIRGKKDDSEAGRQATARIMAKYPKIRVIIISPSKSVSEDDKSVSESDENYRDALRLGACGYMLKSAEIPEYPAALFRALDCTVGEDFFVKLPKLKLRNPTKLKDPNIHNRADLLGRIGSKRNAIDQLSKSLRQLLEWILEGRSTKAIAKELRRTTQLVDSRRKTLMARLNVDNVAAMVHLSLRCGMHLRS